MERKLKAETRNGTGKGAARKLRADGKVPGVVYGHGMEPLTVAVDARDLYHILRTDAGVNVLIDLKVDSREHLVLPREIQRDHIRGQVVHVDFLAIRRDERIHVDVPVRLVGDSRGVKEGGVVEHHLWEVRIECLPGDVPEAIEADITELGIGDNLRVGDLVSLEGVAIQTSADETIVSVVTPQVLQVEGPTPEEGEEAAVAEGEAPPEGAEAPPADEEARPEDAGGEG